MSPPLRVFSNSVCALYATGDKLGKFLGWVSMLPFLSIFFQLTHLYLTRELQSLLIFTGRADPSSPAPPTVPLCV